MKQLLARSSAAVLVAAAALTAACSNDPTAPRAPSAARSNPSGPVYSGYAVTWSKDGPTPGAPAPSAGTGVNTGGASTNSGYAVTWSKDGQQTPPAGD